VEGAIAELRELAHGIHPAVLTDEGLSAALDVLVQRARIPVEIQDQLPRRPPPAVEAVAYYVIAEGLTNIAKHALASRVTVSLTWQHDEMLVIVSDNGVGGARLGGGSGLQGLVDRVAAAGGTLEIDSLPGAGTTIRARFPVEQT
jgi:signal transduction histidine kinase